VSAHTPGQRVRAGEVLDRLGATLPVVAAPMAGGPSTPELVVQAALVGGLGFLAGGYLTPDALQDQILATRGRAARFGVNLFAPNPVPIDEQSYQTYARAVQQLADTYRVDVQGIARREDDDAWADKIDLLARLRVPLVSFTFGCPDPAAVRRLTAAGCLTAQTVTDEREARAGADAGLDLLVVQSSLAGAHSATMSPQVPVEEVPLPELIRRIRSAVDLPVWAAGGVSTATQVRQARAAGAQAVVVGTVLLRSPESGASPLHKAALADPARVGTVVTRAFTGRPARGLPNDLTRRLDPVAPSGYPALHHLTSPLRAAARAAGNVEHLNLWAGAGYRDATDEPAGVILRRLGS